MVKEERIGGYTDYDKKMVTINAEAIEDMLKKEYDESFVKFTVVSALFHELKHWKQYATLSPGEKITFRLKYAEDPEFRKKVEEEAMEYGVKMARKWQDREIQRMAREIERIIEELRMARG